MPRGGQSPERDAFRSNAKLRHSLLKEMPECAYCEDREDLTLDHIRPLGKGGTNDRWNIQTLCHFCNNAKGNQYPYRPPTIVEIRAAKAERGL
jgi:5-methylcytosine-specific restriction endonuclease McrA